MTWTRIGQMIFTVVLGASAVSPAEGENAVGIINTLLAHETQAAEHRGHYMYRSDERSERTGGHLWSERVAETNWGKLHYLVAEDGVSLSGDRLAAEKARVADEAAHPDAFKRREAARADDEEHAKQMLMLLPKAFLFDAPTSEGPYLRVAFRPNPDYTPQGIEEHVLHSMTGSVLVDARQIRLRRVEGNIPQDVSLGFGFLATIHAGSNFFTVREPLEGLDWKTEQLHTDIKGRALFLKTIARQQELTHSGFKKIPDGLSVTDAAAMLEQENRGGSSTVASGSAP